MAASTLSASERILRDWREDVASWTRYDLPRLLVIIAVTFALLQILRLITRKLEAFSAGEPLPSGMRAQQLRTLASVIYSVGSAVIYFLAAMQVLLLFKVDVGPILASAGIAGLAIGFGAQTLVKDVINGFFILLENQYDIGDTVRIANVAGTVEAMSLRKTALRDASGAVHVVPNSEIKVVTNMTRDWALVSLHVAVDYNENSDKVIGVLQETANDIYHDDRFRGSLVAQPEAPGIERVSGHEVDYLLVAKVRPGQQFAVSRELRRRVKDCLQKNNVLAGGPAQVYVMEPQEKK